VFAGELFDFVLINYTEVGQGRGGIPGVVEQPDCCVLRVPFIGGDADQPVQALIRKRRMCAQGHHEVELARVVPRAPSRKRFGMICRSRDYFAGTGTTSQNFDQCAEQKRQRQ